MYFLLLRIELLITRENFVDYRIRWLLLLADSVL